MRNVLPARREAETFDLTMGSSSWRVTVGYYPDNTPGEVFVSGIKSGSDLDAVARDGAILLSLALQHGVPIETIAAALTRNGDSSPSTVIGALAEQLKQQQGR